MTDTNRKTLKAALNVLAEALDKRNKTPVLGCVLLKARQNRLSMRATDRDNHFTIYLPAEGEGGWEGLVDLRALKSLLGLETGPARMDFREGKVCLGDAKLESKFETADFPAEPDTQGEPQTWPAGPLREALEFVHPAIYKEAIKYYLGGAYFHTHQGNMRLVATEDHVMKVIDAALPGLPEECPPFIMREKTVKVLLKCLAFVKPETLTFSRGKDHVFISGAGKEASFSLSAAPIDGTFPDYLRIIPSPEKGKYSFTFDTGELLAMLARIPVEKTGIPRPVEFDMFNRLARFKPEGAATIELPLPIRDYASPGDLRARATVGFNPRILQAALNGHSGEMRMAFENAVSPAVIRAAQDGTRLSVAMPMRL